MEQQVLDEILKSTFTLDSFKKRFLALKLVLEKKIYNSSEGGKDGEQGQKNTSYLQKEMVWAEGFDERLAKGISQENFREIIEFINKYIAGASTLTIYFVFTPDEAQIREIGEWLRKSLNNPKLIFEVKVDPGLIGGCAIAYKGVYKDYSLKGRIEANKEKLMEEFRKHLKS